MKKFAQSFIGRCFLFGLSLTIFALVLNYLKPPQSWPSASIFQFLAFFLSFLAMTISLADLFIKDIIISFVFGLVCIVLVVMLALKVLNWPTFSITLIIACGVIYFIYQLKNPRKPKSEFKNLNRS